MDHEDAVLRTPRPKRHPANVLIDKIRVYVTRNPGRLTTEELDAVGITLAALHRIAKEDKRDYRH